MRIMEKTATGIDLDIDASRKVDRNFVAIDGNTIAAQTRAGMAGRQKHAIFGDSMMDNAAKSDAAAVYATVRMLHHDFNAILDTARYYDADDAAVPPARLPENTRGLNFAKGGTTTQHMLDVQLPAMLEALDAGRTFTMAFGSAFQNDRWNNLTEARASVTRVLTFVDTLLARGIDVVMLGVWPHNLLVVNGTANAIGKHYVERAMTAAAETRPGFRFIPILDLLKRGVPAEEAQGQVNWVGGAKGTTGSATIDDIHNAPLGARLVAPVVAPAIRPLVRAFNPPVFDGLDFDETTNPLANIMGPAGRFTGSGGTLNGTPSNPGAAATNANIPAGVQVIYDASAGVTLTPSLTGNPDWPFRITFSGTPTTSQTMALARLVSSKRLFPGGNVEIYGKVRWVNMQGLAGLACGQGEISLPGGAIIQPIRCPIGSVGGPSHVMPFALTEEVTLHSMAPAGYSNEYAATTRLDVVTATVAGVPISGAIEFSRLGLFRSDYL
jgi:lysophospholipase L1-like esterase